MLEDSPKLRRLQHRAVLRVAQPHFDAVNVDSEQTEAFAE